MATCCKKFSGWFFFGIAVGFIAGLSYFVYMVYAGHKNDAPRNINCPPGATQCRPILDYETGEQ